MSVKKLRAVDELVHIELLINIDRHLRALELLSEPTHTILMKMDEETYFVLYTISGDILILQVDDPESYDVIWKDNVAIGIQVVESALEFFKDLLENHPEELTQAHLDFVVSLKLLQRSFIAPMEERLSEDDEVIEKNLLQNSAAEILDEKKHLARALPKKRKRHLLGQGKDYVQ